MTCTWLRPFDNDILFTAFLDDDGLRDDTLKVILIISTVSHITTLFVFCHFYFWNQTLRVEKLFDSQISDVEKALIDIEVEMEEDKEEARMNKEKLQKSVVSFRLLIYNKIYYNITKCLWLLNSLTIIKCLEAFE